MGNRTPGLPLAKRTLCQLSYDHNMVIKRINNVVMLYSISNAIALQTSVDVSHVVTHHSTKSPQSRLTSQFGMGYGAFDSVWTFVEKGYGARRCLKKSLTTKFYINKKKDIWYRGFEPMTIKKRDTNISRRFPCGHPP